MTLRLSTAARNATGDTLVGLVDNGGAGRLEVYTGDQPEGGPDDAATGTLLVTFALSAQAYADFAAGIGVLGPVADAEAVATGTAGWARMLNGAGTAVLDGDAGDADTVPTPWLRLNTTAIVTGGTVSILSGSLTMPAGV